MSMLNSVINKITGNKSGTIVLHKMYDLGSDCLASPLSIDIDGDRKNEIICSTAKGELFVFDDELKLKWKFNAIKDVSDTDKFFMDIGSKDAISSTPKVFDINNDGKREIMFGTEQGEVFALDFNGNVLWEFKAKGPIRGGINVFYMGAARTTRIIFGSLDGHLYILNEKGRIELNIDVGEGIESTPIIFEDSIIIGLNNGEVRAYNVLGKVSWSYLTDSKITSEAVAIKFGDKKYFVIGSTNNSLYCFSGEGKLIWRFETAGSIYSKVNVSDINNDGADEIVFGAADNKIHVLSREGTELWSYETGFWILGTPIAMDVDDDGLIEVIAGSYDNTVYFLTAEGSYVMEYVPGISGIVAQNGSYSDIPTGSPGSIFGKKIWEYKAPGIVIGCCNHNNMVVVQTKEGKVIVLKHER
ncbi:MAG: PQQ-binding-like beta-propeller repeat protein [Candidatus Nanoarchaeia archaeon]